MGVVKKLIRTTEVRPYDYVLHCGICGTEVFVVRQTDTLNPPGPYDWAAESAAEDHLAEEHRFRYWLYRKLGWRWLVGGLSL